MKKTVIYPGSFDAFTYGHMNIIKRASNLFDEVVIGVAVNSSKNSILSIDQRVDIIKRVFSRNKKIKVDKFEGLLVHFAKKKKINTMREVDGS